MKRNDDDQQEKRMSITDRMIMFIDMRYLRYYDFQIEKCQASLERTTMRKRSYKRKIKLILKTYGNEE